MARISAAGKVSALLLPAPCTKMQTSLYWMSLLMNWMLQSEKAMLQHFKQLTQQGKMVILITHNQQSLSFCNKIISLDEEA
jgi:hypothetical protein